LKLSDVRAVPHVASASSIRAKLGPRQRKPQVRLWPRKPHKRLWPHRPPSAPRTRVGLAPVAHQSALSTGNVERDTVNQQEQNQLRDTQEKQRQELQQQQAADHERPAKQPSASANVKTLEQQHQAQTQALVQRHTTEQKTLQETQQKRPEGKGEAAPHT